jgi:hypothetical protein
MLPFQVSGYKLQVAGYKVYFHATCNLQLKVKNPKAAIQ